MNIFMGHNKIRENISENARKEKNNDERKAA